ncbi:hypothetical protein K469DRAFT_399628 [Zopfia rhizophila CBS 207.26]|uniref:C2H2-type domain-containing protein n=1 Tax=Zopfia rhizophila CBS 207.26 TaxID=1314779 RepID=A0A6A6DB17_9PEZI|nr:hypothetical protein K469DRAFT_399628 [Zopfia rhizophila CBS 207.26]
MSQEAHRFYANLISARFPDAAATLVDRLGKVNWERKQRLQHETEARETPDDEVTSKFHDSGIGSSIPTQTSNAATVISFFSSLADGTQARIPRLSEEAKAGAPFTCDACGKTITVQSDYQWKEHIYQDLRPYICFFENCSFNTTEFRDRKVWMDHLRLEHRLGPRQKDYKCPLCLEDISTGRNPSHHIAKHLEEISLAALPQNVDSTEMNDANQGSQRTGISKATFSDPKTMTVNSLGNLYEDQGELDEAEKMYERALDGKEKALVTEPGQLPFTQHQSSTLLPHADMSQMHLPSAAREPEMGEPGFSYTNFSIGHSYAQYASTSTPRFTPSTDMNIDPSFGTFVMSPASTVNVPQHPTFDQGDFSECKPTRAGAEKEETPSASLAAQSTNEDDEPPSPSEAEAARTMEDEQGKVARSHHLYQAQPDENGEYHCHSEGKQGCNHKPTKLKCNYE